MAPLLLAAALAAAPPSPAALLPPQAGFVVTVDDPARLVAAFRGHANYAGLDRFPQVREQLDSTQVRRALQLLQYLESKTGTKWPELVKKLAGGGLAFGLKVGDDPAPAVLAVRGTDEAAVKEAFQLLIDAATDAAAQDPAKPAVARRSDFGADIVSTGKEFFAARRGSVTYIANNAQGMTAALSFKGDSAADNAGYKSARTLLEKDAPLAWAWLDLAALKSTPASKDFFKATRQDFLQSLVVGGTIDAARRADTLAAGLFADDPEIGLSIRMPAKRADADDFLKLHLPKDPAVGSLPLITPKNCIAAQSFYLDLAHHWKTRKTSLNDEIRGQLETADKDLARFVPGATIGQLLDGVAPFHRLMMVETGEKLYSTTPGTVIPPFALITRFKDADTAAKGATTLKAAALLGSFQTGWTMAEKQHNGTAVVTYTFPEKSAPAFEDPDNLRFNFAPSIAVVGNEIVTGSTPGALNAALDALAKAEAAGDPAVWRFAAYGPGAAAGLKAAAAPAVAQAVLAQGITLGEAEAQVNDFAGWLAAAGFVEVRVDHAATMFRFDAAWKK